MQKRLEQSRLNRNSKRRKMISKGRFMRCWKEDQILLSRLNWLSIHINIDWL